MPAIDYIKQLKNQPFESVILTIAAGDTTVVHAFTYPWTNAPVVSLAVVILPLIVMSVGNVKLTVPDYPIISALSTTAVTLSIQQAQAVDIVIHVNCLGNPD